MSAARRALALLSDRTAAGGDAAGAATRREIVYLCGLALYVAAEHSLAVPALEMLYASRATRDAYPELAFYLADAMIQSLDPAAADADSRAALTRAAALFTDYLEGGAAPQAAARGRAHVATAMLHRGLCYARTGEFAPARETFETLLHTYPGHARAVEVRYALADACLRLGDREAASRALQEAARASSDIDFTLRALSEAASVESARSAPAAALAILEEALEGAREAGAAELPVALRARLRFDHALALAAAGRKQEGARALEVYLEEFADDAHAGNARIQLAYLQLEQGEPSRALATIDPLVHGGAARPGRDQALYQRAWCYRRLAEQAAARDQDRDDQTDQVDARDDTAALVAQVEASYRQLIREHPESPFRLDSMLELAQHLFNAARPGEAKPWFVELLDALPPPPGAIPEGEGDPAALSGAQPEAARVAELRAQADFGLASILAREGEQRAAAERFDRVAASSAGPLAAQATFAAGRAWLHVRGEERRAAERFERIVALSGKGEAGVREEALLRLAESYHRLGRYDASARSSAQQLAEYPHGAFAPDAHFARGFALQFLERFDEAIEEFATAAAATRGTVAARALYHTGECYLDQDDPRRAARAFTMVVANFPDEGEHADWVRRALLAAGISYLAAGETETATGQWRELAERFPETPEGQAATQRLRELSP